MKKGLFVVLISLVVIIAFGKQIKKHCGPLICSRDFKIVAIKFKDSIGNPVAVTNFKAINLRSKQSMVLGTVTDTVYSKGLYTIASDLHINKVSEDGDTILISGMNPVNNIARSVKMVIGKDDCSCHVTKLSGPEEVVLH